MKTKTISSTLAALFVAGGLGIAYAQTTEGVGSGSGADTPSGRVENSTNASTTNETLTPAPLPGTSGSSSMTEPAAELPAQTDRG